MMTRKSRDVGNPQDHVARLWMAPKYWWLVAGHFTGWEQGRPSVFKLPVLPQEINSAYEFESGNVGNPADHLERTPDGILATVHHGLSGVLLPNVPECPPLLKSMASYPPDWSRAVRIRFDCGPPRPGRQDRQQPRCLPGRQGWR